jgi:type II secretory pathway predicted ATPase ExeA
MSGVVRPSAVSFGAATRAARAGGDPLPPGKRVARSFQAGTDPGLLWPGRAQVQVLDRLEAGVRAGAGVLLLTGDVGTGKTILAKALLERLRADTRIATVTYAQHDAFDFWKGIAGAWGGDDSASTAEALRAALPALLHDAAARSQRVLLFVDEAQALSRGLLAEIERLAVMAGEPGGDSARVSILLVGQDDLLTGVLARPENAALAKRVAVRCTTGPLTEADVRSYVLHQLKAAGTEGTGPAPVFTDDGLRELAAASQGIPRLINTIAGLAVLSSAQQGRSTIGADVVRECGRQIGRPLGHGAGRTPRRSRAPAELSRARRPRRWRPALYVPAFVVLLAVVGFLLESAWHRDLGRALGRLASSTMPSPDPATRGGEPALPPPVPMGKVAPPAAGPRPAEVPALPAALHPPERPVVTSPGPLPLPPPVVPRSAPAVPRATEGSRESVVAAAPTTARAQPPVAVAPLAARPLSPVATGPAAAPPHEPATAAPPAVRSPEPVAAAPPVARPPEPVATAPTTARAQPPVAAAPLAARPPSPIAAAPAVARSQEPVTAVPAGSPRAPRQAGSEAADAMDPGGIIDWLLSEYPARKQ